MSEIVLGLADSGRSLQVHPGDAIVIEVDENLGTGYSWEVVNSGGAVVQLTESVHLPPPRGVLGAPGKRRFRFVATAAGGRTIDLRLRRPWEAPDVAAQRLSLQVTVSG